MQFASMVLFLLLAAQVVAGTAGTVSGTAIYRERIALPPDAVFEATLEDVSKADAPAEVIGQVRLEAPGHPPIHFTISYESTRIEANRWQMQGFSRSAGLAVVCRSRRSRTTQRWKPPIPGHATTPVKNSW